MLRHLANAPRLLGPLLAALAVSVAGPRAQAQGTATTISGIYNTGLTPSGGLQAGGSKDANWSVTYASTNGGTSANTAYEGAAYVINPSVVSSSGYTANTSNAQWIVAPGAYTTTSTSSSQNAGGNNLPGNGNTGSNEGVYIYTLAFTISGTGGNGAVIPGTNSQIQITMTLAADDQYAVYVNPTGNGTSIPTGTAAASATSAWNDTTQVSLQNYGTGTADNSTFKIGTNYIVVVVDNTNSITGSSTSTALNPSGLLVYETSAAEINGKKVPEVATWLPMLGAAGCYGLFVLRRRRTRLHAARA
ncbi:MAG TPA: hypothetical protein VN775_06800 [Opitutaceae bacterium]|nr:hypothetical protein [Opitutaceae bacterium]